MTKGITWMPYYPTILTAHSFPLDSCSFLRPRSFFKTHKLYNITSPFNLSFLKEKSENLNWNLVANSNIDYVDGEPIHLINYWVATTLTLFTISLSRIAYGANLVVGRADKVTTDCALVRAFFSW